MKKQRKSPTEEHSPASAERKTVPTAKAKKNQSEQGMIPQDDTPAPADINTLPKTKAKNSQAEQDMIKTVKGGSILMVGRLFTYICRLIITFVLARLLAAENYGLYNLAVTAATVGGAMAVFGLDTTLTRFIAILNARNDRNGIWGAIQVALGMTLLLSAVVGTGLFALAYPIAENIFHEPRLAPLLQISSLVIPFLALSDVLAGATRGFKNMRDTVIAQNFAQPTIRLILIAILAVIQIDVTLAVIAFGFADFCASAILLVFLNRRFNLGRSLASGKRNPGEIFSFAFPLWLSDMLLTFRGNIQTLLLGSLYTVKGVGIFSIVNQVTFIGNIFHASISQSAKPLIAELHDQGKLNQLMHMYQTTTRWVVTLNLPLILVVVLFPSQLISIFGKSFAEGAPALAIMGLVNLVHVATGMCGALLEITGHNRIKLVNTVIKVSVAILANFLLIPPLGITGAALAALIQEVISDLLPLVQLWVMYRLIPYNWRILKPLLAGLIAAVVGFGIRYWLPITGSLVETILHIVVVLAVYGAAIQLLGLPEEERTMVHRLRRRARLMFSRL